MKKSSLLLWLVTAVCVMSVFTACDKKDSEEDNRPPSLQSFFDINITRCERVGAKIVVEFNLKNKSGQNLSEIYLSPSSLIDDLGKEYNTYDNIGIRLMGALTRPYEMGPVKFDKGETKQFEVVAGASDAGNVLKNITLVITGNIKNIVLSEKTVTASASVKDNRVLDNGVQTNDTGLKWVVKSCKKKDGNLYLTYNVTNNTGVALKGVMLQEANYMIPGYSIIAVDDMGQTYGNLYHAVEGSSAFDYCLQFELSAGETKTIVTRIVEFDKSGNATKISVHNTLKCDNYLFTDPIVRFNNIPIK